VADGEDFYVGTFIPEVTVPSQGLKPNRWALIDRDTIFDTITKGNGNGPGLSFTTIDTAGCSNSAMLDWVALVGN